MEWNWVYVGLPVIEGPDYHVRLGLGRKEKASVLFRVWQSVHGVKGLRFSGSPIHLIQEYS